LDNALNESTGASSEIMQTLAQARAVLSSEVDDPEDLQTVLRLLEHEPLPLSSTLAEAVEAVMSELRVRLAALREDTTTVLETILKPRMPSQLAAPPVACPPGWQPMRPSMANHADDSSDVPRKEESVMTCISNDGLETAIELATSLGIDTEVAEEQVASDRGLLSLKITWGAIARFCLLPVGVSFMSLKEEVVQRFRLKADTLRSEASPFRLYWRDGAEVLQLKDQASWEVCLHARGLHGRPGRLELQLEVPFVITGTRVPTTLHGHHGVGPDAPIASHIANTAGGSYATPAVRGPRPRAALERQGSKGRAAALQRASGGPSALPPRQARVCRRRGVMATAVSGSSAVPLHLEGRAAVGRCVGAFRAAVP